MYLFACVSQCLKPDFATQALTVSAACSCRFIKLFKTSLCFVLAIVSFIHNDCFLFNLQGHFRLVEPLITFCPNIIFKGYLFSQVLSAMLLFLWINVHVSTTLGVLWVLLGMFRTTYFKNQLVDLLIHLNWQLWVYLI